MSKLKMRNKSKTIYILASLVCTYFEYLIMIDVRQLRGGRRCFNAFAAYNASYYRTLNTHDPIRSM